MIDWLLLSIVQQLSVTSLDVKKIKNLKQKKGCRQRQYHTGGGASASQVQASLAGLNPLQGLAPLSGLNSTVPPLSVLRQEACIQQEVQQRLQDKNVHTGNGRVKSQRGGPVDIFMSHRIKWPHEYVLSE